MELQPADRVHFIGVGGISMSGLAHALRTRGFAVSGSDRSDSPRLQTLRDAGVAVAIGHAAGNVAGADVVIRTTAIRDDNPEWAAAVAAGRRCHHRSELLAWMLRGCQAIAVTGTHGKTTMTAMLAHVMVEAGLDPTAFVGGDVVTWGSNYRLGTGPQVVFEADESDGTFRRYTGCSEVISCVEFDHGDQHGTMETIEGIFAQFIAQADPAGFVVWGADCPRLARLAATAPCRRISAGMTDGADWSASEVAYQGATTAFTLRSRGEAVGRVRLAVPGEHNVRNALAVLAAADALGIPVATASAAMASFAGTGRRFEFLAEARGIRVYDDYAHHPTEVRATLRTARQQGADRVLAIFQPHLYSRTRDLMTDFIAAFDEADVVIITDIYAAREDPLPGVSSAALADGIRARGAARTVLYVPDRLAAADEVMALARPGDLLLSIGAGDVRESGERMARVLLGEGQ